MIVLEHTPSDKDKSARKIVAIFGLGLIGRSILSALGKSGHRSSKHLPFSWESSNQRCRDTQTILQHATQFALDAAGAAIACKVSIVWAAGRAGLMSPAHETEGEIVAFKDVLAFAEQLCKRLPEASHEFHLISSAGGLFEGQCLVDHASIPRPQRPYGQLKFAQERLLVASTAPMTRLVYRISSAYGFSGEGLRLGLVGVLVKDAIRHSVSRIFGMQDTLRDYILAADIGRFVARQLSREATNSEIFLLASGKPSAMCEILRRVEQVLARRLYVQFDMHPSAAGHNSYRLSALPAAWKPTDLETGIHQTALALREAFVTADALKASP